MANCRIMVVDDSGTVRQAAAIVLKSAGYDVIEACDGVDALGKLAGARVGLVICDLNMPKMDGLALLRAIKASSDHRFMPFVMLTTEASEVKKEEGRTAGAKAWMTKPFEPVKLLDVAAKLLPLSITTQLPSGKTH